MAKETHSFFQGKLAAYALGSLEPDEVQALEAHLNSCASCREELTAYRQVSDGLLSALPPQVPPSSLRNKLVARLPGEGKTKQPNRLWSLPGLGQWAAVAAVVLLLGVNLLSFLQIRTLQKEQASLAAYLHNDQTAIAMLAYPGTQSLPVSGEGLAGSLLMDKENQVAVLFVWNLPGLKPERTYQVWLIDAQGDRVSGGIFLPEVDLPYTSVVILSPQPLGNFSGLGVTVEPQGGSPAPTGPRVLKVDF